MHTLRQQFLLFKKTRQCFWIMLIYMVLSLGYTPCVLLGIFLKHGVFINGFDVFLGLQCSLSGQLYGYIVFMFVTYEFLSLARSQRVSETLSCMPVSRLSQEKAQLLILFFINLFLFAVHFLENVILAVLTDNITGEYIWYSVKLLVLYVIGVNTIAILSGYMISMLPYKIIAYSTQVLLAFFAALRYQRTMVGERFGTFTELTEFFSLSAKWATNEGFLIPVELHFWAKSLIVISALLFIVFIFLFVRVRKKRIILYEGLLILVMVACFGIWKQEISGSYPSYEDEETKLYYYTEIDPEIVKPFHMESCMLEMKVDNYMHIQAEIKLVENDLDMYYFTLFSGFDVTKVNDLSGMVGNPLDYTFDGNVLEIKNKDGHLEGIRIEYEGVGTNQCFAGKQGICLMGNVPWYPMPGIRPYNPYAMEGQCALEQEEIGFGVEIDYSGKVYCNLFQYDENAFAGRSNHVTLVAGFWQEEKLNGIDYIFPRYSTWYNPKRNADLREAVEKYYNADAKDSKTGYTMQGKKIIIAPYEFEGGHYLFGTDAVVIGGTYDIENFYLNYIETGEWYKNEGMELNEENQKMIDAIINGE